MNSKFVLELEFDSRYGEVSLADHQSLQAKIVDWAEIIIKENNEKNKHLGLHFIMKRGNIHGAYKPRKK